MLKELQRQIDSLSSNKISVIVVDDASTDGTGDMVVSNFPDFHLLRGNGSLWWTGSICRGMEYSMGKLEADYILWLNDDCTLKDDFIVNLIKICAAKDSSEILVGGIIRERSNLSWIVFGGFRNHKPIRDMKTFSEEVGISVDTINGNIALIPRKIIDEIGFPDEKKFKHYGGDYEYGLRAKKKGFKIVLTQNLQGTVDYTISDCIRYMPLQMQWYFAENWLVRLNVIRKLTSLKSKFNIWQTVNMVYADVDSVSFWVYLSYYLHQIAKFLVSDFLFYEKNKKDFDVIASEENFPDAIIESIKKKRMRF